MASVMLAAYLSLHLLGAVFAAHHYLHEDAAKPDHHCAVELLASGTVLFSTPDGVVLPPASCPTIVPQMDSTCPIVPDHLLLPGRAPPILPS
jgi:hypothetical protein